MTRRRLVLLVLLVTALLAIVALAAGGRPLGASPERSSGLPTVFWDYVFTTVVILFVIGAVISIVARFSLMRELVGKPKTSRGGTARTVAIVLAMCVLVAFIGRHINLRRLHLPRSPAATSTPSGVQQPPTQTSTTTRIASSPVHFQWPELVVILGVLVVLGGLVATRRLRHRSALEWRQTAPEVLAAALDESLDDLRAEPDLRRAIVAAYARMEITLAAAGVPRRPAEAPLEYVERALLALDTSAAAVRRLTDLFEWARFSHHEPESAMRDEAVDALVAVRDELRAAERVAA